MKELNILIYKPFTKGLAPRDNLPIGSDFLETCSGVKVEPYGLRQLDNVPFANIAPLNSFDNDDYFIFPQLVINRDDAYFMDRSTIYQISNPNGNVWRSINVSYLSTKVIEFNPADFGDYTTMVSIFSAGDRIHIYDYINLQIDLDLEVSSVTQYDVTFVENHGGQENGTLCINRIYTETGVNTYDAYSPLVLKAITGNMRWHVADFGTTWFMFNGACTIFKANFGAVADHDEYEDKIFVEDSTTIQTGCAFRGRLITGGFDTSNFWNSDWQALWDIWRDNIIDTFPDMGSLSMDDVGSNYVMWSSVGGDLLFHFYPHLALSGYVNTNTELAFNAPEHYLDYMKKNQMGFMPMHWNGSVLCTKVLGDKVVVYGDNGIGVLFSATINGAPTFGYKALSDIGIYHRDAVGGDDVEHMYIDSRGNICTIDALLAITNHEYSNHIKPYMVKQHVVISVDSIYRDYYIVFGDYGDATADAFLLSKSGLSVIYHYPNTLYQRDNDLIGVGVVGITSTVECVTLPFNMFNRGIKHIPVMEISASRQSGAMSGDVQTKYTDIDNYSTKSYKGINKEGHVYVRRTGNIFKACFKCTAGSRVRDVQIDNISMQWKQNDKRQVRGLRHAD